MRRRLALALGLAALFVLPASASATVTMTDFTVEPSSKQGGGHPSVTITQAFSYDNATDSVKDLLPAPVGVRLDAEVLPIPGGTRNTFASNPDLPVRSFTLAFDGGRPDAALRLASDLCADGTDLTMSVKLIAHNGKRSEFTQELATPGCDPVSASSSRSSWLA